jgi:hypothetical protein
MKTHIFAVVLASIIVIMLGIADGSIGGTVRNFPGLAGAAIGLFTTMAIFRARHV